MSVNIKNGRAKGDTGKRERREHRVWVERGVPSSDVKNPGVIVLPQDHFTNGLTQDSTSERGLCVKDSKWMILKRPTYTWFLH